MFAQECLLIVVRAPIFRVDRRRIVLARPCVILKKFPTNLGGEGVSISRPDRLDQSKL